jgi:hypothetical protein
MIELLNVLKFVVIIFISLSYFKSQNYMKIIRKNLIGIANLHISTIFKTVAIAQIYKTILYQYII